MNKSINITTLSSLSYARWKNWINIAVKGVIPLCQNSCRVPQVNF